MNDIRARCEIACAAFSYECDLAPLSRSADCKLASRIVCAAVDGTLNTMSACHFENIVKGIVTRVGKGTKVVLLGDPAQIDHPLLDTRSNGLTYASARMKGSPLCVQLTMLPDECERSSLALDAAMRM